MSADPTITLSWSLELVDVAGATPHTLRLTGRLGTRGAALFREQFPMVAAPGRVVHLNLDEVDYISSAGIAALREAADTQRAGGGGFEVVSASESVRVALELAGVAGLSVSPQTPTSALPSGAR